MQIEAGPGPGAADTAAGARRAPDPVTVLVADEHPLYRRGLVEAIYAWAGLEVAGQTDDAAALMGHIDDLRPTVAVVGLATAGRTVLDLVGAVRRAGIPTGFVVLTEPGDWAGVLRAVAGGAVTCVPKDADRGDVCRAIERVGRETHAGADAGPRSVIGAAGRDPLTPSEAEALRLTARGLSAPEIGYELGIGSAAAKRLLASLCESLGVADAASAVERGRRRGLL